MIVLFPTMHYTYECVWRSGMILSWMQTIAPLPQHFRESVSASVLMFLALHLTPPQQGVFLLFVWFFGVIFCSIRGKSLTWRCTRPLGAEFTFRGSVGRDGHTWSHLTTSMVEFWVDFRRRSYGTRTKPQESHTNFSWAAYFKCSFICIFRIPWTHPICRWTINI